MSESVDLPVLDLSAYRSRVEELHTVEQRGRIAQVIGLTIEVEGLAPRLGELCWIYGDGGRVAAEVVGFRTGYTLLMPLGEMDGVRPGSPVTATRRRFRAPAGRGLLGRVLDGLGRPLDGKGPLVVDDWVPIRNHAPHPLRRRPIREPICTGIRAIDGLITVGKGQRIGIFAGSGVGKSSLLGMIARNTQADVNVIALIGERGREVRDFIEQSLGPEGMARTVLVVSTSNEAPLVRIKAAWVATAIAEHFRDVQGLDVTFLMDSVTRFAMAQREVGLAVGEPPAMKAYPPSVFTLLPRLMERTGASHRGTVTAFYTVLVEGDDFNEPISDAVRSILDGHMMLSRELAAQNHYPAIDVLHSASRLMAQLVSPAHLEAAGRLREALATYQEVRDLIHIGAYVPGSNPEVDQAIRIFEEAKSFLRQSSDQATPFAETEAWLQRLVRPAEETDEATRPEAA